MKEVDYVAWDIARVDGNTQSVETYTKLAEEELQTKKEILAWELAVAAGFFVNTKEEKREVKSWREYIPMAESTLKLLEKCKE